MATLASVIIQDLTYAEKNIGNGVSVSYTNGATAGAEVVSTARNSGDTGWVITVQIAAGTSTATQIRAAVMAHAHANCLVTVTVSGTGSNAQVTVNGAALAGGAAAAKASTIIDNIMMLEAKSTGTAGNSIRFKFTGGATAGSEAVTVSSSDISVQIEDGVSTYKQVKDAIEADSGANALVAVTTTGAGLVATHARVSAAIAFVTLAGGAAAAAPTVILQDLTYVSDTTGTANNGKTITYTTGATAGSEVVSVSSGNVNVQIENGVSTATQIETALNAVSGFTTPYSVSVSGTGATAQKTVNLAPTTGAVADPFGTYIVTNSTTALTSSFVRFDFHFPARQVQVVNDETSGAKAVVISLDGTTAYETLTFGQVKTYDMEELYMAHIWLKYSSAAPAYHLWARA